MSLSEYGGVTDREHGLLQICRAMGRTGFVIEGAIDEAEARALARRLAMRGYVELSIEEGGETARITSKGFKFLTEGI